jgi:hypothetical protein
MSSVTRYPDGRVPRAVSIEVPAEFPLGDDVRGGGTVSGLVGLWNVEKFVDGDDVAAGGAASAVADAAGEQVALWAAAFAGEAFSAAGAFVDAGGGA